MLQHGMKLFRRALNRARVAVGLLILVHLSGGALFSLLEGKSFFEGQWWATVSGFTVGYGDLYPSTTTGRLIAMAYIATMAALWLILGAHIVATIIEDKNLFSNEEQERLEACVLEIAQKLKIVPEDFTKLPSTKWFAEHHGFMADEE